MAGDTHTSPPLPLISVVTPIYNAAPFLMDSVRSILAQTHSHLELILVVDTGSTDRSVAVAREAAALDKRIRLIEVPRCGRAYSRNVGAAAAQGEWLAWQDADDVATPDRLAVQLAWMRANGVDVCGSCTTVFGDREGMLWFAESHRTIQMDMFFRTPLLLATGMVRTEIVRAHPFDVAIAYEEYEWYTRLFPHYRFGNVPQILLKERSHSGQSHRREGVQFLQEQQRFRRCHFFHLYPDATEDDYAALAVVLDKASCAGLHEVRQAGEWLARLANVEDAFWRARMALRWQSCCLRSAHLGLGVFRLFEELLPAFRAAPPAGGARLRLACALRLRTTSPLFTRLTAYYRQVKGAVPSLRPRLKSALRSARHSPRLQSLRRLYRRLRYWWPQTQKRRKMLRFYAQSIQPGDLVFDVGAHVGVYSDIFLRLGARVVAVEPQRESVRQLWITFHNQPNLQVVAAALGKTTGTGLLFLSNHAQTHSLSREWIEADKPAEYRKLGSVSWGAAQEVPMRTLDGLIRDMGRPVFVKIDAEGYESEIVQGLTAPLPALSLEFHTFHLKPALESIRYLRGLGPTLWNYTLEERFDWLLEQWVSPDEVIGILEAYAADQIHLKGDLYVRFHNQPDGKADPKIDLQAEEL